MSALRSSANWSGVEWQRTYFLDILEGLLFLCPIESFIMWNRMHLWLQALNIPLRFLLGGIPFQYDSEPLEKDPVLRENGRTQRDSASSRSFIHNKWGFPSVRLHFYWAWALRCHFFLAYKNGSANEVGPLERFPRGKTKGLFTKLYTLHQERHIAG